MPRRAPVKTPNKREHAAWGHEAQSKYKSIGRLKGKLSFLLNLAGPAAMETKACVRHQPTAERAVRRRSFKFASTRRGLSMPTGLRGRRFNGQYYVKRDSPQQGRKSTCGHHNGVRRALRIECRLHNAHCPGHYKKTYAKQQSNNTRCA